MSVSSRQLMSFKTAICINSFVIVLGENMEIEKSSYASYDVMNPVACSVVKTKFVSVIAIFLFSVFFLSCHLLNKSCVARLAQDVIIQRVTSTSNLPSTASL